MDPTPIDPADEYGTPDELPDDALEPTPGTDDDATPDATPESGTDDTGRQSDTGVDDATPDELVEPTTSVPTVYLDEIKGRLFRALVAADGRLADPDTLPYDDALLDDPAARDAAITAALERNPRLGRHGVAGDVGTGPRGGTPRPPADLITMIREAQGH